MGVTFASTPLPYGVLHLSILAAIALLVAGLCFLLRKLSEKGLLRLLFILGCAMIAAEVFKQWFVWKYVYGGALSTWFFPWQLCSMAMYCSAAVFFTKGKAQDVLLVFLATFSLVAAVFALIFPGDMMRPQILLFCHSFLYHFVMVIESVIAMILLARRKKARFWPAIVLYTAMAAVAQIINIVSHYVIGNNKLASNMFNITPFYPSTQPVFHEIALAIGVIPEIFLYLGLIVLASFGVYLLIYLFAGMKRRKKEKNAAR